MPHSPQRCCGPPTYVIHLTSTMKLAQPYAAFSQCVVTVEAAHHLETRSARQQVVQVSREALRAPRNSFAGQCTKFCGRIGPQFPLRAILALQHSRSN